MFSLNDNRRYGRGQTMKRTQEIKNRHRIMRMGKGSESEEIMDEVQRIFLRMVCQRLLQRARNCTRSGKPKKSRNRTTKGARISKRKLAPRFLIKPSKKKPQSRFDQLIRDLQDDKRKLLTPILSNVAVRKNTMMVEVRKVTEMQQLAKCVKNPCLKFIHTLPYKLKLELSTNEIALTVVARVRIFLNGYGDLENKSVSVFVGALIEGVESQVEVAVSFFLRGDGETPTFQAPSFKMTLGNIPKWKGLKQFIALEELGNFVDNEGKMLLGVKFTQINN